VAFFQHETYEMGKKIKNTLQSKINFTLPVAIKCLKSRQHNLLYAQIFSFDQIEETWICQNV
jgi:hypothetical protein